MAILTENRLRLSIIVRKALTLKNFTPNEIIQLYDQHTKSTGQIFEPDAIDKVHWWTDGQPWLVNAIALEILENQLETGFSKPITTNMVELAVQTIILRRDVHIDSLLERLNEQRVRKIIEPVILGFAEDIDYMSDDFMYCLNLGLIKIECFYINFFTVTKTFVLSIISISLSQYSITASNISVTSSNLYS